MMSNNGFDYEGSCLVDVSLDERNAFKHSDAGYINCVECYIHVQKELERD